QMLFQRTDRRVDEQRSIANDLNGRAGWERSADLVEFGLGGFDDLYGIGARLAAQVQRHTIVRLAILVDQGEPGCGVGITALHAADVTYGDRLAIHIRNGNIPELVGSLQTAQCPDAQLRWAADDFSSGNLHVLTLDGAAYLIDRDPVSI